jgi:hypothetical protein
MKALIQQAYEIGVNSFPEYKSAPALNPNFMKILPNCEFGDEKGCKLRVKIYKSYIKGWTESLLKSMVI